MYRRALRIVLSPRKKLKYAFKFLEALDPQSDINYVLSSAASKSGRHAGKIWSERTQI